MPPGLTPAAGGPDDAAGHDTGRRRAAGGPDDAAGHDTGRRRAGHRRRLRQQRHGHFGPTLVGSCKHDAAVNDIDVRPC